MTDASSTFGINAETMLIGVFYGWAVMVGVSRVMLGVHFPGDTLAGATLGTSTTVFIHSLVLI
jgi:undecaprenyl-diphosphatase